MSWVHHRQKPRPTSPPVPGPAAGGLRMQLCSLENPADFCSRPAASSPVPGARIWKACSKDAHWQFNTPRLGQGGGVVHWERS